MGLDLPGCAGLFAPAVQPTLQPDLQPKEGPVYPSIDIEPLPGIRLQPVKPPGKPGKKRYGVVWDLSVEESKLTGKERASAFFASPDELAKHVAKLNAAKRKGAIDQVPTQQEIEEWRMFKAKIGNTSPLEVYAGWMAWRTKTGAPVCDLRVSDAVDQYLEKQWQRVEKQQLDVNSYRQKRCKLLRFKEEFGLQMMDEPTADQIEEWIDELEEVGRDGQVRPLVRSADTFNDHIKQVRACYYYWKERERVASVPTDQVTLRDSDGGEIRVLPPRECAKLLSYAMEFRPWMCPRLTLEMYMGARFTLAAKIKRENFNFELKLVEVQRRANKTRKPHNVQGMPDAFWSWIKIGFDDERAWSMSVSDYMHAKSALFLAAGVENPGNALRHTFASNHVAYFKNPGVVATLLLHRDQQMLWSRYLGKSTEEAGEQYFLFRPHNVAKAAAGEHLTHPGHTGKPRARGSSRAVQPR